MCKQGRWGFVPMRSIDLAWPLPKSWLFTFKACFSTFLLSYLSLCYRPRSTQGKHLGKKLSILMYLNNSNFCWKSFLKLFAPSLWECRICCISWHNSDLLIWMLSFSYGVISDFNFINFNEVIQWIFFFPSTSFQDVGNEVSWTLIAWHQLSHRKDIFFLAS